MGKTISGGIHRHRLGTKSENKPKDVDNREQPTETPQAQGSARGFEAGRGSEVYRQAEKGMNGRGRGVAIQGQHEPRPKIL